MIAYLAINSFRNIIWQGEWMYAFQMLNDPINVSSLQENESAIVVMQWEL